MPTTDQQARAIAFLAAQCRPIDAPSWQEAGIVKRIVGDPRDLHDVILDAIACALDPDARTPGAIGKRPWRTRLLAVPSPTARNPRPDECCKECGRAIDTCAMQPCEKPSTKALKPVDAEARLRRANEARALLGLPPKTGEATP